MEQNLEKRTENALTKSTLASYVHDMKELEIKAYTLKKLRSKCSQFLLQTSKHAEDLKKEAQDDENLEKQKLYATRHEHEKATQQLNKALQNRKTKPQEIRKPQSNRFFDKCSRIYSFLFVVLGLAFFSLMTSLIKYPVPKSSFLGGLISIVLLLLSAAVSGYIVHLIKTPYRKYLDKHHTYDQYVQELSEYEQQEDLIEQCHEQYVASQRKLENAEKQYDEVKKECESDQKKVEEYKLEHIKKITAFSEFVSQHLLAVEGKIEQLYALNIVPPDYQTLDCLIEFDQMFRNDLVDTMRQAVMIYEERVFRGELIRGIDNIYNMLGNLCSTMHNIETTLRGIKNEVSIMSSDIYKIATSAEKFQDDMLSESRAARYATEAVQTSTKRCEWYLEKQYSKS